MLEHRYSVTRRRRAVGPLLAGVIIAAAGLVAGGIATASAHDPGHGHSGQPTTKVDTRGDAIPNVTLVENRIKAYYGDVPTPAPAAIGGTLHLPDPAGNYADEVRGIASRATKHLATDWRETSDPKRAIVLDIDDTSLNTYDYEVYSSFAYNPTSNALFVTNKAFPAVFGMAEMANWASTHGYAVFFITGRPEAQRVPTAENLADVGFTAATDTAHLFLKNAASPPAYLSCGSTCTTIQYKSGTRAYIESQGYDIVANFGDQFSDLKGGYSDHTVKMPNPMYYLP